MTASPPSNPHPRLAKALAVFGLIAQASPLIALWGTASTIAKANGVMTDSGIGDPSTLSAAIGEMLVATFVALFLAIIGSIAFLIALIPLRYRARWFYLTLWISAFVQLLAFPIGTAISIFLMIYLKRHQSEFATK